jgi:hypothetical protein
MCRSQPSVRSGLARRGIRELKMIKGQPLSAVKTLPTVHLKATQTYVNSSIRSKIKNKWKIRGSKTGSEIRDQRTRGSEDQRISERRESEVHYRVNVTESKHYWGIAPSFY